jgi:hypothetical protein
MLIIGIISTIVGILPFYFAYPLHYVPISGPSNGWELILMLSYEGQKWYLLVGIVLLLVFGISFFIQQKVS